MTGTGHSRARVRWISAAGVAAALVAALILTRGGEESVPAPAATAAAASPPPMTVVPSTVEGVSGCLQVRGFEVVRRTERSLVVRHPELRRAAVMIYPSEPAAQRAAAAAAGWEAVGNTRIRLAEPTPAGRTLLLACLAQPLTPAS